MGLGGYLVTGQQIVAEGVVFHLWRKERKRDLAFGFVFMESKLKERKENATQTHQLWGFVGGALFVWFLRNKLYNYSQGLFPSVISFINSITGSLMRLFHLCNSATLISP